jgi:pyroglutamyl-peptidase
MVMHCLVTGFDPFDNAAVNPSQQAVERLPARLSIMDNSDSVSISTAILPTCCDEAWALMQKQVSMLPSDDEFGLILTGYAHKREKITPERYALNVRDYRIADNRGHQWTEERLVEDGSELLICDLPLAELVGRLNRAGLPAEMSFHAGTFVCNEVFYRSLHRWSMDERCIGVLFVHFPSPANYATVVNAGNGATAGASNQDQSESIDAIDHFAKALHETIRFICATTGYRVGHSRTSSAT